MLNKDNKTYQLVGKALKEISLPKDSLVALINRDGNMIIPKGDTILDLNDRLTIIGNPKSINEIRKSFLIE